MIFGIVSDKSYETKVDQDTNTFRVRELEDWLYFKNYGSNLIDSGIVLKF